MAGVILSLQSWREPDSQCSYDVSAVIIIVFKGYWIVANSIQTKTARTVYSIVKYFHLITIVLIASLPYLLYLRPTHERETTFPQSQSGNFMMLLK